MSTAPFPLLLTRRTENASLTSNAQFVAWMRDKDGDGPAGFPGSSEAEAVHRLYEAQEQRPLAFPFAEPFTSICRSTVQLGRNYQELRQHRDNFHATLQDHIISSTPLPRGFCYTVHGLLTAIQSCIISAKDLIAHLPVDARDDAKSHPLFSFGRATALCVSVDCSLTLTMMGSPSVIDAHEIEGGGVCVSVEGDMDLLPEDVLLKTTPGWATDVTLDWFKNRDDRIKLYLMWLTKMVEVNQRVGQLTAAASAARH